MTIGDQKYKYFRIKFAIVLLLALALVLLVDTSVGRGFSGRGRGRGWRRFSDDGETRRTDQTHNSKPTYGRDELKSEANPYMGSGGHIGYPVGVYPTSGQIGMLANSTRSIYDNRK